MATLQQKIDAEEKLRELLEEAGLPPPDDIEYGHTCIRALWHQQKACVVVDIDDPPPGWEGAQEDGPQDPELGDAA